MAVRQTIARIKLNNKHFEIIVDLDLALKLRKGEVVSIQNVLLTNDVFSNSQDGSKPSSADLMACFGTSNTFEVADRIVKKGEIQLPKEFKDEQREVRKKKIIDWYSRNAVDVRNGRPFTPQMISSALDQAGVSIDNRPIDQQINEITEKIQAILPLKVETKKLAITIPAIYTGKVYGAISDYKEREEWLSNGSLRVIVNIPVGLQSEFYDKLNAITHGAALSEEIKQAESLGKK